MLSAYFLRRNITAKCDWLRLNRSMHSHVLARTRTSSQIARGEKRLAPSHSLFSPADLEMPIQILRVIFVAIKCYVFGLMAQKYSILSMGRASSYKDKFGGGGGGGCEEGEGYTNDTDGGERASLWHLRGYSGHFCLTHVEEARRRGMRGMRVHFYEVLRTRKRAVNTICAPEATTSLLTRCHVVVPYAPFLFLLSPGRVRAIRKFTFARSRYSSIMRIWKSTKVTK